MQCQKNVWFQIWAALLYAAAGFFDDLFERHGLEFGALLQVVQVHHIGVVVLAVVVLQGFLAVMGCQRVDGIGQRREGVFHGGVSLWCEMACRRTRPEGGIVGRSAGRRWRVLGKHPGPVGPSDQPLPSLP